MYDMTWKNKEIWEEYSRTTAFSLPPRDPKISKAALLLWEEHCVECAIPDCYTSCSLYTPRLDQKCRRFPYGMMPNKTIKGLYDYGIDIFFLRWAKVEAEWHGMPAMISIETLKTYDRHSQKIGSLVNGVGNALQFINPKRRVNGLYSFLRQKWMAGQSRTSSTNNTKIDAFYIKFYCPGEIEGALQLEIVQDRPVFRDRILMKPGWNEKAIPFREMHMKENEKARIRIFPANDQEIRLIFTWLDFVIFEAEPSNAQVPLSPNSNEDPQPAAKVKCVVWDLDNTLWEGVIGEVGSDAVKLNTHAMDLIKLLDERGVVQSIASKNTFEIAWSKIKELGLAEYFLYPAIHWGQKSQSLKDISKELNINLDTFAFIDDSPFERSEVQTTLPQIRCYDPIDLDTIIHRQEFDLPVSDFSRQRRLTYLAEVNRKTIAATWTGDYEEFIRSCEMILSIRIPQTNDKQRCLELLQRTNQLNLSGRRLTAEQFDQLLQSETHECFALECRDKFGEYGIVGFSAINIEATFPTLIDFVLSCRVAQKKIEETFIYWFAARAQKKNAMALRALFAPTDRNLPLHQVLKNIPFQEIGEGEEEKEQILEFSFNGEIRIPDIIKINSP